MRLYKPIVITVHYRALAVYRNEPRGICQTIPYFIDLNASNIYLEVT